jgi:hypothetical protein
VEQALIHSGTAFQDAHWHAVFGAAQVPFVVNAAEQPLLQAPPKMRHIADVGHVAVVCVEHFRKHVCERVLQSHAATAIHSDCMKWLSHIAEHVAPTY